MTFETVEQSILVSLLEATVKPVLLLGAGASKQSGVMLASEMVEEIAKTAYCKFKGMRENDPRVTMSDWKKWLSNHAWYDEDYNKLYPIIIEKLLKPKQFKRNFFSRIIHPQVAASRGYEVIAELMHLQHLDTVLTTNFDDCLYKAHIQVRKPHYISMIKTPFDVSKVLTYVGSSPQVVYLHGSVEHYTDCNLVDEVQNLDDALVREIKPILKDRPLVVIGYRGAEPSIMKNLLIDNIEFTKNFHNGIYWCVLNREVGELNTQDNQLSPLLIDLATKVGDNFQFVRIEGFDELMFDTLSKLKANEIDLTNLLTPINNPNFNLSNHNTSDYSTQFQIGQIEFAIIRERLKYYCERLRLKVYDNDDWLYNQMLRLGIAKKNNENILELTECGVLLFSTKTQEIIPNAIVILKFIGEPSWLKSVLKDNIDNSDVSESEDASFFEREVRGNIWDQLNEITNALSLVNSPYRLKGDVSENVYPYPTLALKEVIVNCLVHRDYRIKEPVLIEVYSNRIVFKNPGGLVEDVKRQLLNDETLEAVIKKGRRGVKGYRNPVLADLFYGTGAMDKEGSGLSDVVIKVHENSSEVSFGQPKDSQQFEVIIYCRPDLVNKETETPTAISIKETTRFTSNILEVIKLPTMMYHAETHFRYNSEVWKSYPHVRFPPFYIEGNRIWSIFNLADDNNPLRYCIVKGTDECLSIDELVQYSGNTNSLVRMLNVSMEHHLSQLGLRIERNKSRLRAYFTKTIEGNPKEITYQGRIKKATRTVAKPRKNSITGNISYWEHKGIWFSFERIGDVWYLMFTPTYVFTKDGYKELLKSKRVNSLSTKKASRDYNIHVHNDLTFWSSFISQSKDSAFHLNVNSDNQNNNKKLSIESSIIISSKLPSVEVNDIVLNDEFIEPDFVDNLEEIESEIVRIAEKTNIQTIK